MTVMRKLWRGEAFCSGSTLRSRQDQFLVFESWSPMWQCLSTVINFPFPFWGRYVVRYTICWTGVHCIASGLYTDPHGSHWFSSYKLDNEKQIILKISVANLGTVRTHITVEHWHKNIIGITVLYIFHSHIYLWRTVWIRFLNDLCCFSPQKALENDASSVFVQDPGELFLYTVHAFVNICPDQWIRMYMGQHWSGWPRSGSVLGMRIQIKKHGNWLR